MIHNRHTHNPIPRSTSSETQSTDTFHYPEEYLRKRFQQPCPMLKSQLAKSLGCEWVTILRRIRRNDELKTLLQEHGFNLDSQFLTQKQVEIFYAEYGPPLHNPVVSNQIASNRIKSRQIASIPDNARSKQ